MRPEPEIGLPMGSIDSCIRAIHAIVSANVDANFVHENAIRRSSRNVPPKAAFGPVHTARANGFANFESIRLIAEKINYGERRIYEGKSSIGEP